MSSIELWLPSLPDDPVRWLALVLGAVVLSIPRAFRGPPSRSLFVLAPLAAAALSAAYVVFYLRGGPRIIDATAYWLEARTFASGTFTFPVVGPEASVMGRFLVRAPDGIAVIFPPGYPAVLALGFLIGAPLAIGPTLAALITWATMDLARVMPLAERLRGPAVRLAAMASVFCATLRYHTADTMAHGLAALCLTVGAAAALRVRERPLHGLVLGAALGLLFATRPASALAGLVLLPLARPAWGRVLLGALPGVVLWLAYQDAATGSPWLTAQELYYASSDGPPGCFRYGFGAVGCLGEHGDFVEARMPDGYGALETLGTAGRRLAMHVFDPLGFAPAYLVVLVGIKRALEGRARWVALLPLALLVAYAPFYFDGNYLGGGARMLADVLPVEHVLAALGLAELAPSVRRFTRGAAALVGLSALAFAFHQGAWHADLRARDGGGPMFEGAPSAAMVFVGTDHGFNLAFEPGRAVARHRGDVLDRLAWEAHGRPPVWRYEHYFDGRPPRLTPMRFSDDRLEAESLWPARWQSRGWAFPEWRSACASGGRALVVRPTGGRARIGLALPESLAGALLAPRLAFDDVQQLREPGPDSALILRVDGEIVQRWSVRPRGGCIALEEVRLGAGRHAELVVETEVPLALDALLVGTR